jgi:hypothetical protein
MMDADAKAASEKKFQGAMNGKSTHPCVLIARLLQEIITKQ